MLASAKQVGATNLLGKASAKTGWGKLLAAFDGDAAAVALPTRVKNTKALATTGDAKKTAPTTDSTTAGFGNHLDRLTSTLRGDVVLGQLPDLAARNFQWSKSGQTPAQPQTKGKTAVAQVVAAQPAANVISFRRVDGQTAAAAVAAAAPVQNSAVPQAAAAAVQAGTAVTEVPTIAAGQMAAQPGKIVLPEGMTPVAANRIQAFQQALAGMQSAEPAKPQTGPSPKVTTAKANAAEASAGQAASVDGQQAATPGSGLRIEPVAGTYEAGLINNPKTNLVAVVAVAAKPESAGEILSGQDASAVFLQAMTNVGQPQVNADLAATAVADNPQASAVTGLGEQLVQGFSSVAADGTQQMVVRLDPPELGSVRLTLESQGNQVRAVVETDNPRTLADLRTEAPALIQRLADSGIQVQSMDMVLTQQGSYHSQSQNPWQQQGWAQGQQQDLWQQQASAGYADTRGLDARGELVGASTVADNAINIWI